MHNIQTFPLAAASIIALGIRGYVGVLVLAHLNPDARTSVNSTPHSEHVPIWGLHQPANNKQYVYYKQYIYYKQYRYAHLLPAAAAQSEARSTNNTDIWLQKPQCEA